MYLAGGFCSYGDLRLCEDQCYVDFHLFILQQRQEREASEQEEKSEKLAMPRNKQVEKVFQRAESD